MNAKLKFVTVSSLLCAAFLIFTSTAQGGTWPGFRRLDTTSSRVSGSDNNANLNGNSGARMNQPGIDNPMNHDMDEDRDMNQPGDDNGRRHRRHRGRH
jgi:hypothetical protein